MLRHLNIGIAVGYHRDLMHKSRQGFESATRQGWHTGGIACYGYRLMPHEHPNPHKARQGRVRHTLDLDPVRAPVVRRIFDEYLHGTRGLTEIRDLLNSDPQRFPPPNTADPARSLGAWSRSSVWEILRNPKYTGYQVWNRRARKDKHRRNRPNPPEAWVWSEQPCHPPIVNRQEYDQVRVKAASNARSRRGGTSATQSPPTAEYLFRGRLRCGYCGLRMKGHRGTFPYYRCHITMQRAANIPPGHPVTINLSERFLLQATLGFLSRAVYGPDRLAYWQQVLASAEHADPAAPTRQRIREVEQTVADLQRRLRNQLLSLEDDDLKPEARRHITSRIAELEQAIADHEASLAKLHDDLDIPVAAMDALAPSLDRLPVFGERLRELSQRELRRLFDSLDLTITYDHKRRVGRVRISLPGDAHRVRGSGPCPGQGTDQILATHTVQLAAEMPIRLAPQRHTPRTTASP